MKIVCPACEATYDVPESVLASKRQVRCARCGNDWVPGANWQPEPAPAAEPAPTAETAQSPAPAQTPPPEPPPQPAAEAQTAQPEPPPAAPEPPAAAPEPLAAVPDLPPAAPEPTFDDRLPEPDPAAVPPAAARLRQSAATAFGNAPEPPLAVPATRTPVGAWIASILLLVALAGAGVAFKTQVMKAWPPSERLYNAIGLNGAH
jgi:predicted Zn finger-like uncharacterized protein